MPPTSRIFALGLAVPPPGIFFSPTRARFIRSALTADSAARTARVWR